ncbi:MAG: hypothetical protein US42_C0011G0010 [Candidatus Magasanikbacteria bacterium GW2011_GWC2_37_14]|uniref:Squalene cyclase C-terminal domain-containing protein n=1 Tax=Candidatus Magasanikbacteria bacterium GW2011_GWC2_37_14 TaxID=1619046 RepID=A0A0G0GBD4_9BACT|nr:MAG: hypothetical protein US42_C0011G0010 [Candidatus Magasanikbacteria bacterium GW2011_GWC2_37_14]
MAHHFNMNSNSLPTGQAGKYQITFLIILIFSLFFVLPVKTNDTPPEEIPVIPPVEEPIIPPVEEPVVPAEETTSTPTIEPEIIEQDVLNSDARKILNYFKTEQDETGKIINANISDWAMISFAANEQYGHEIKKRGGKSLFEYILNYDFTDASDLNVCATYPRHILALLAAGVDKNSTRPQELKEKLITTCYKDNNFGDNGINDDVFALFTLLTMDETNDSSVITDLINTIQSWQLENGAFAWPDWMDPNIKVAGDDITGVTLNALIYAKNKGINVDQNIINNVKNYLKTSQLPDGGWGYYGAPDVLTTSWVMMGLNALSESQAEWTVEATGKNPWSYLHQNLKNDGFYEPSWSPGSTDWFATKHAVPAILGLSWPIVMEPREEETNISNGPNYNLPIIVKSDFPELFASSTTTTLETTTTTLEIATSTLEIVSTTIEIVTTTPEITTIALDLNSSTLSVVTSTLENTISTTTKKQLPKNNSKTNKKIIQKPQNSLQLALAYSWFGNYPKYWYNINQFKYKF